MGPLSGWRRVGHKNVALPWPVVGLLLSLPSTFGWCGGSVELMRAISYGFTGLPWQDYSKILKRRAVLVPKICGDCGSRVEGR